MSRGASVPPAEGVHAQVAVRRYDVYLGPAASRALPAGAAETSLWRADERAARPAPHPLSLYSLQALQPNSHGKTMVDPEHVATFEARSRSRPPQTAHADCQALAGHSCAPLTLPSVFRSPARLQRRAPAQVHNGVAYPRTDDASAFWVDQAARNHGMDPECGYLVHAVNLFEHRYDDPADAEASGAPWHWVFDSLVGPSA